MKELKLSNHAFQGNAWNREQLKKVLGGVQGSGTICIFHTTGNIEYAELTPSTNLLAWANEWCLTYIRNHPATRCSYDGSGH